MKVGLVLIFTLVVGLLVGLATVPAVSGEGLPHVVDGDADNIADVLDNCPTVSNADQEDLDADGLGDSCDPDRDGDGIYNVLDNCPRVANQTQLDGNLDGIGDRCEHAGVDTVALSE